MIKHPSGDRKVLIDSPWRQENIKRVVHRRYSSLASSLASSERTSDLVIIQIAHQIKQEVKDICAESHNSILQHSHESIKRFSWKTIWLELLGKSQ